MSTPLFLDFTVDKTNKTIDIRREFAADRSTVWDCYTRSEILDQWWMPLPWKSNTKAMDFSEGGKWHYSAIGPNGEVHWSLTTFLKIEHQIMYTADDAFCDADGNINKQLPQSKWTMNFSDLDGNTLVHVILQFSDLHQLEQTIAMGFKEGLTMAMENLDALLANGTIN